ncbi:hypothetical protein NDN08_006026 [Rhodosorus marinus]|uniref:Surfeit locus protein 4 n=1 Tax=Rhodosorus marinus TaxID=101924 RepID=A0AAV8UJN1_9RHOD|nr:hypothetical protein NDN08_006026 [Rhodosorus marinus]
MDYQGGGESDDRVADFVKTATVRLTKLKKVVSPYFPIMARFLLILTFLEDGIRVLFEFSAQVYFLKSHYGLPKWLAGFILIVTVLLSFVGAGLVMTKKYEVYGSYVLLGFLLYQQIMYGHISPVNSGGFGFLFRNLSLAGAFFLLIALKRLREGRSALPGLPDPGNRATLFTYFQLTSRILMVLLAAEFIPAWGGFWFVVTIPVILCVLVGYKMPHTGIVLIFIYFLHNVLNSAFWSIGGGSSEDEYKREILKYEFVQTLSIMGGLMLLVSSGPGMLSVDERIRRKNF